MQFCPYSPEGRGRGGGGVLRISSDRDDRMGQNKNPKESLGFQKNPKKIAGPEFNHQKIPCRISEP